MIFVVVGNGIEYAESGVSVRPFDINFDLSNMTLAWGLLHLDV